MQLKVRKVNRAKSVLTGVASALNLYGSTQSVSALQDRLKEMSDKMKGGRSIDYDKISQDWQNIGSDLRFAYTKAPNA